MMRNYKEKRSAKKYRDYDREILSEQDYAALQGYQNDYANATDQAGRDQAHQNAEDLRQQYGYSMGADGGTFSVITPRTGVSTDTNAQLLHWNNQNNNPTGQSAFYNQWNDLVNQYTNREPFEYDLGSDALYQQYAQQYQLLGNQAMQDTMGQAAALTGGYHSSYAQSAGQQAYQRYLDQLNNMVPELYNQAYNRYNQEGNNLLNAAQLASQGYQQEVSDYWNNTNYWQQQAANEQNQYWNQQNFDVSQQQYADSQQQQAYDNLVTTISNTGYTPTSDELAAAGMTQAEAQAWANYYTWQRAQAAKTGGSGSSGGGRGSSGRSSGGSSSGGSSIADAAAQWIYNGSGHYIDDGATQAYMDEQNLHGADRQEFVNYLLAAGWGYSWNAGR